MDSHAVEIFPLPKSCGWCKVLTASTLLYGTPTCKGCAEASAKDRVQRWLNSISNGHKGRDQ